MNRMPAKLARELVARLPEAAKALWAQHPWTTIHPMHVVTVRYGGGAHTLAVMVVGASQMAFGLGVYTEGMASMKALLVAPPEVHTAAEIDGRMLNFTSEYFDLERGPKALMSDMWAIGGAFALDAPNIPLLGVQSLAILAAVYSVVEVLKRRLPPVDVYHEAPLHFSFSLPGIGEAVHVEYPAADMVAPRAQKHQWMVDAGDPPQGMVREAAVVWYRTAVAAAPTNAQLGFGLAHVLCQLRECSTTREAVVFATKALCHARGHTAPRLRAFLLDLHLDLAQYDLATLMLHHVHDCNREPRSCDYHEAVALFWSGALVCFHLGGPSSPRARESLKRAIHQFPLVLHHLLCEPLPQGQHNVMTIQMTKDSFTSNFNQQRSRTYVKDAALYWWRAPGAMDWLRKCGLPLLPHALDKSSKRHDVDTILKPPKLPYLCTCCNRALADAAFCGVCRVPYCDSTCSKKDWPRHKASCTARTTTKK